MVYLSKAAECSKNRDHLYRHYATFDQFTEAILGFFPKTLPLKWRVFTDTVTVTVNFRIISLDGYKVI